MKFIEMAEDSEGRELWNRNDCISYASPDDIQMALHEAGFILREDGLWINPDTGGNMRIIEV